eukprot:TRINITY_DN27365_c0_g1_i2.p1 TRINITY_DN27365_c0_g1~~TRINITY_DN27365_c0_g1_i2.p1  ORF type:complete len:355 (+),score=17.43 TRINITY_DN27365_c0_g1_i2:89-1153(+)
MDSKTMNNKSDQSLVPWSDLTENLLHLVCSYLCLCDYLSFRSVCSTWRVAAKQLGHCLNSPLLMLPRSQVHGFHYLKCPLDGRSYKLNLPSEFNLKYQCLGSFHGWLLMIHADRRDTIFLFNPFTSARIDLPQWGRTKIYKAVLSSAPSDPNCTVIILDESYWSFKFCRVGDGEWTKEGSDSVILMDALVLRGKFYLLCSQKLDNNTTTHLELEYLELPDYPYSDDLIDNVSHLVESGGEVLLVVKRYELGATLPHSFMVFRLDPSTLLWIEMNEIGNRVLFLGRSCSSSFTSTVMRCRENLIYFTEPFYDHTTWWVFNMEDGSIESSSSPYNSILIGECVSGNDPLWITPNFV